MFHVHRSNRLEPLLEALVAETRAKPLGSPFAPEWIAVQSLGVRAYLEREIASRTGVFANVAMPFPEELFRRAVVWALGPDADEIEPLFEGRLALAILDVLPGLMGRPELAPVRRYVELGGEGRALHAFSRKIAHAFSEYALYRPALIDAWSGAAQRDDWQPILFRAATARLESATGKRPRTPAELARDALAALGRTVRDVPARISLFGIASLPPLYVEMLAAFARHTEVHLYMLSPSCEFYGDSGRGEGNRLIAAMGRLGREFQSVLEERVQYLEDDAELFVDPASGGASTVLASIQSDMLRLGRRGVREGSDAKPLPRDPGDWSIKVCACRSPLREIEAVRDEILAFVGSSPAQLRPDEIAVLAPDIAAYAPFIEAVFRDVIPYALTRAPAEGAAPLLDEALALLALAETRLSTSELFGFLARPPVMRKLGLGAADLDALLGASLEAGARFGIDADHRARHGLPALVENTWRFALDRVLVGLAISAEGDRTWRGVLPWSGGSADPSIAIALAGCVTEVIAAIEKLTAPRPLSAWCADLRGVIAAVCDVEGEKGEAHAAFGDAVAALEEDVARSGCEGPVGPGVFAIELGARAPEGGSRRGFAGGVVCADLSQMRGVPFRGVFLVGMNGSAFPRRGNPPSFDLMAAAPHPGDRSPREEDKALFLEAILAARDRLGITFSAEPGVRQDALPSSVVSQLLDVVEEGFTPARAADLVVRQPVEPFAPAYFAEDPASRARLSSHDRVAFAAASARLAGGDSPDAPLCDMEPLPLSARDVAALDFKELLGYFLDPCRNFCERVLGIIVPRTEDEPPEREPFSLDPLMRYGVGSRALRQLLEGATPDELYARAAGAGQIPIGAAGMLAVADVSAAAVEIADAVEGEVGELAAAGTESVPFSIEVGTEWGPCAVSGLIDGMTKRGRIVTEFGRVNGKRLLRAWIPHLASCCLGAKDAARTFCIFRGDKTGVVRHELGPVEDAREQLARLVAIYWEGQRKPLALFPSTSHAFAAASLAPKKKARSGKITTAEDAGLSKARDLWYGGAYAGAAPGEGVGDAARILFGDAAPWERDDGGPLGFRRLALDVFGPIVARTGGTGSAR